MRHAIAAVVLASLLVVLYRVVPPALEALRKKPEELTSAAGELAIAARPAAQPSPNGLRVLFIGNSHTFFHDLPLMVQQLAAAASEPRPFEPKMIAVGGATLEQHLAIGDVREPIATGRWHYVVLQDQQQRPSWSWNRQLFFAPARTLDVLVRAAGARTVLYMTAARREGDPDNYPGDTYAAMQARSIENHVFLAQELGALVAPAGKAWQWALRERPNLPLWEADGMHPSVHGSYLTACVFYVTFYGRSPLGNRYHAGLPDDTASFLQRAAQVARNL